MAPTTAAPETNGTSGPANGAGTPTGLRLQMTRLRRRIGDLGLEVRSVRGKGYVLQNRATSGAAQS